jgi:HK97 family phage major capsid protein
MSFTLASKAIVTLAHWIPASRQVLADAQMLGAHVDNRLRYGLALEEEDQILNGAGTGGNIDGLLNQATAYNAGATGDQRLDTILKAMRQVMNSEYIADGILLSNFDWTEILLLKDTQGRYLFGNPAEMRAPQVWGLPVVATNAVTNGTFAVAAFQLAAQLWDREDATVRVAEQHSDFFVRNMVAILAEERMGLTVTRATAIVKGSF